MDFFYDDNRVYILDDDLIPLGEVTFPNRDDKRVDINHVFVIERLRGQGIASELMKRAYDYIKSKDLKIVAKCPYAIQWFKAHPQYQDIVINVKTRA
jgi:predicted GNAT family acetyltransferase